MLFVVRARRMSRLIVDGVLCMVAHRQTCA